jgi:hypothetical protein
VDLVKLNDSATTTILELGSTSGFYSFNAGHGLVWIHKWSTSLPWGPVTMFSCERVQLPDANVVLSLALTRANTNVVVTARVLDGSHPATVLYEHSVVDTPEADHALTSAEFSTLSGMDVPLYPDVTGTLSTTARPGIGVFQYNSDGSQPTAVAIFDNLELRSYEVPSLGITRAVRLSWPASATLAYAVEGAPTVNGPWLPVRDSPLPGMEQMTVPASSSAQFFRLRQAP